MKEQEHPKEREINPSTIGISNLNLVKEIYKDNIGYTMKKLSKHYPVQYLIGYVDFYNTKINVNKNVLIPRFETELLVEKSINFIKKKNYKSVIDLCTGSGAIAIALKKNLDINIDACDISTKALKLAKNNAQENSVDINFYKLNVLKNYPKNKYDCLISNPPYVNKTEYTSPETKYEPKIALYAKNNGLIFYEKILKKAHNYLNKKGSIIFEIGASQSNDITNIVKTYYPKAKITVEKDYNNFERFMFIELN